MEPNTKLSEKIELALACVFIVITLFITLFA